MIQTEMKKKLFSCFEAYAVALLGAILFSIIHIPLAWLLGPITAVLVWQATTKRTMYTPFLFRQAAFGIFGYMLGTSFTRETAWQIFQELPFMFVTTISIVAVSLLLGYLVSVKCGIGIENGIFGSVPGGLSQMVILSEEIKSIDVTVVSFMQTIRLLSVIFFVPFLTVHGIAGTVEEQEISHAAADAAQLVSYGWIDYLFYAGISVCGAVGGMKAKLPAAILTGPLLATALVAILTGVPAPEPAPVLVSLCQIVFGTYLGLMVNVKNLRPLKKTAVYTIASSMLLLLFALGLGELLSMFTGSTVATTFISMAPGGIAEMGITAAQVQADLSVVSGYQLFRVFFVMFAIPPLLKWWVKRRSKAQETI